MLSTTVMTKLKPAYEEGRLFYFSSTALKSVYASHIKEGSLQFDEEHEIVTWIDDANGLKYHFDFADINTFVESMPDSRIAQNAY
jgi:hypothetical protein